MANGVNDPVGGLNAALTPEQLAGLQASGALMQQRLQAAMDPNRTSAFDKYVADQAAKGVEVASTYTGGGGPLGSGGVFGVTDFAPAFDPTNPAGTTGQVVRFDPGRMNAPVVFQPGQQYVLTDASGENVVGRASSVEELQKLAAAKENMPYGFQLYRADEQGQYQPGTQLFGETDPRTKGLMGAIVNYGLPIVAGIATGGASLLPSIAASAAASGAAKLMTGYTAEDAAKAAAIAGATRGVLKGTGLEDALGQVLAAKGSAAGNVVGNAVNPGFYVPGTVIPKFVAPTLSGLSSTVSSLAAAPVAGEILVQGARNAASPALTSAISGGLSTLVPAVFDPGSIPQFQSPDVRNAETSQQNDYQPGDEPESVVTGNRIRITPPGATLPINLFNPSSIPQINVPRVEPPAADTESDEPESVVTGNRIRITPPGATLPINLFNPSVIPQVNVPRVEPPPADTESDDAEQVVTGKKIPPNPPTTITFPNAPFTVPPTTIPPFEAPPTVKKPDSTIAKVTGGLTILDTLSKLLGGTRGGTGGTGTGLDSLAPIFRAQLPAPRGQFAPSALTQRDRSDIDYARYGYGPARSFFNYVPETAAERAAFAAAAAPAPRVGVGSVFSTGAAPVGATTSVLSSSLDMLRAAMPGASDAEIEAFLNTPEGRQALTMIFEDMGAQPRAKGGKMGGRESFAVDGVGTGRSDEIPALLSDGEYVIDAETVAMLGDGSSKAGAKRLDDFRVKVRKHKGRNLAKGKFSANAKRPERYLSGGLV
jgi:hypothetical protein